LAVNSISTLKAVWFAANAKFSTGGGGGSVWVGGTNAPDKAVDKVADFKPGECAVSTLANKTIHQSLSQTSLNSFDIRNLALEVQPLLPEVHAPHPDEICAIS
jgi:hypothetical protein